MLPWLLWRIRPCAKLGCLCEFVRRVAGLDWLYDNDQSRFRAGILKIGHVKAAQGAFSDTFYISNVNDDSIRAVPLLNSECQFCLWRLAWIDATNVGVVFNSALKHETLQLIIRITSKCLLRWLWRHINGEGCCLEEGRTVSGRPSCDATHTPETWDISKMISSNKLAMKWTCFAIIIQFLDLRHFPPPSSQNCKGRQGFQWFWHHHHQNNTEVRACGCLCASSSLPSSLATPGSGSWLHQNTGDVSGHQGSLLNPNPHWHSNALGKLRFRSLEQNPMICLRVKQTALFLRKNTGGLGSPALISIAVSFGIYNLLNPKTYSRNLYQYYLSCSTSSHLVV